MTRPPVAVGLVAAAGMDLVQQVAARLRLLEVARARGYNLVQVLELGERRRDSDVYAAALSLARRTEATAFLLFGDVDPARLHSPGLATVQTITVAPDMNWFNRSRRSTAVGRPALVDLLRGHASHQAGSKASNPSTPPARKPTS